MSVGDRTIPDVRQHVPLVDGAGKPKQELTSLLKAIGDSINGLKDSNGFLYVILAGVRITIGSGSPAGVVSGSPPDIYLNTAGGASSTFFVKESGVETTAGWVGK